MSENRLFDAEAFRILTFVGHVLGHQGFFQLHVAVRYPIFCPYYYAVAELIFKPKDTKLVRLV